jgi:glycosyltransferase involved in cell wall biosynthesis
MKIALIIPTRGDRPKFLKQCYHLISRQTLKADEVIVVDYAPKSGQKDLTQRYRYGVEQATKKGCDCAIFWEDDDWYHPTYLEWLIKEWKGQNKPMLFGVGETYYYNLAASSRLRMKHPGRTSAFCTLLRLPYKGGWPADNYPYIDMHFHKTGQVKTINFPKERVLAIGIKHGVGMCGGGGHLPRFKWDMVGDKARKWFVKHMDSELKFYDDLTPTLKIQQGKLQSPKRGFVSSNSKKPNIRHGQKIVRKKVNIIDANSQLRRRGRQIIKVRRK